MKDLSEKAVERGAGICVIGLGGTIAMAQTPGGLVPARSVSELLDTLPVTPGLGRIESIDLGSGPSSGLGWKALCDLSSLILTKASQGFRRFVVIQGTDTLEEAAFAIELSTRVDGPIVFTGAMRGSAQPGTDGPANLLGAILVAGSEAIGRGVYVCLNDEVHAARYVRKAHTTSTAAFTSGEAGSVGRIHEGAFHSHPRHLPDVSGLRLTGSPARVALVQLALGDEGELIDCVSASGFDGCILEAMGAGHVPARLVDKIEDLARKIPVVLTSRVDGGRICTQTYGYAGSETDLLGRGIIAGGGLHPLKARILLALCISEDPLTGISMFNERIAKI